MMAFASAFLTSAFCLVPCALTQAAQVPVRDAPTRPSTGTAVIAGAVLTDEPNGRPLRRVTLTLTLAGAGSVGARMATTDDQGRFAFTRLPAGTYTSLRATRPGFVTASYGQKRTGGMGTPIALAEGQHLTVTMKMLRGGVITGVLSDQSGKPAVQVQVQASQIRVVNGERVPGGVGPAGGGATTDDRGVYRIFGLAPGDYLVMASPRFIQPGTEVHPVTAEEVQWAQQQLRASGAVSSGAPISGASAAPPRPAQAITYALVYYPGTTDAAGAAAVSVAAGQELSGIDFRIDFVPTAKIEGTVLDPDGQPAERVQMNVIPKINASVTLSPSLLMLDTVFSARPQVNRGQFTIPALRPGEYTISARASPRSAGGSPPPSGQLPTMSLWAMAEITVAGVDQSDIVMRLEPGMTISGRVTFEGRALQPPADLTRVSLRLMGAPSPGGIAISVNPSTAQVAADGSFTFTGITPGRYLLSASASSGAPVPGTTWQIKSAMINGVDNADTPLDVKPGQHVADAVLTFTDTMGEVSGTLTDAAGRPTSDFSVILFSTDRTFWWQRSRRLRAPVRTGTDGTFKFTGLPPGDYYVAALTDFEPADASNSAFLDQVAASGAIKITLGEGEKKTQNLRLAGGS